MAAVEPLTSKEAHHMNRMTGPVFTSKQAAHYCGIATQTLYNLISQGQGPKHYKYGKRNAFYAADLDEWNQACLRLATP